MSEIGAELRVGTWLGEEAFFGAHDPVIRATQKVKGIADRCRGDLSVLGDGGLE